MTSIIEVKNLEKSFKNKKALNGITFDVRQGEILCFLGPNGAGKSTVINILSTVLDFNGGEILFNGRPLNKNKKAVKECLGIVPQDLALYEELSAESNIRFFASLYGLRGGELKRKTEEALNFAGLLDRCGDKVKTFSGGMKRRLNIACAIAHKPEVIIMDEPTVGIDPQSRNHILHSIKELRENGATVIYTTHYMEEVEEISTRIIIIDNGSIVAEGAKEQLKESLEDEKLYRIEVQEVKGLKQDDFYRIEGVKNVALKDNCFEIATLKGVENLDRLIALVVGGGLKINNISGLEASLERVFLNITGRSLRD